MTMNIDHASHEHLSTGMLPAELVRDACALFSVFTDPIRFEVLSVLAKGGEKSVTELLKVTSAPSQPGLSHHLAKLRNAGLIQDRRSGKNNYYSFSDGEHANYVRSLLAYWEEQVRANSSTPPHL